MSATGIARQCGVKKITLHHWQGPTPTTINRPGQTYAVFVRSPQAHANIKRSNVSPRESPGCSPSSRRRIAADKSAGSSAADDHCQGRTPMKAGAHTALAQGTGALRWRPVAVVIGETLAGPRTSRTRSRSTMRRCRRSRPCDRAERRSGPGPRRGANNTVYQWPLGDKALLMPRSPTQARDEDRPRQ